MIHALTDLFHSLYLAGSTVLLLLRQWQRHCSAHSSPPTGTVGVPE
jgi:hypothetical protein